jgi:hypothetical protein
MVSSAPGKVPSPLMQIVYRPHKGQLDIEGATSTVVKNKGCPRFRRKYVERSYGGE